ncbi:MAG: hypothetical protein J4G04_03565, partial [Nitrosopumilaceae archaeon]|nr:hypothetical protein [Nitrosopumilaceae archaeon]
FDEYKVSITIILDHELPDPTCLYYACQVSGKLLMIQGRARRYGAKVAPDAAREMGGQAGGCTPHPDDRT